jgi:hypothetical protein
MKKIFLMAAFAGLLGSSAIANTFSDDKDKKAKNHVPVRKKKAAQKARNPAAKRKPQRQMLLLNQKTPAKNNSSYNLYL